MSRSDDERIADIVEAAAEIAAVVERGKSAWDEDRVSRLAVERLLEIIGESARAMTAARPFRRCHGPMSSVYERCWRTTTTVSIPSRSG